MDFSVKALYKQTKVCARQNHQYTEMFETLSGVGQGDTLIPTLFCNFINDLYLKLDQLKFGLFINNRHIPMLLYGSSYQNAHEIICGMLRLSGAQNGFYVLMKRSHK